jgi:hypothetical protein
MGFSPLHDPEVHNVNRFLLASLIAGLSQLGAQDIQMLHPPVTVDVTGHGARPVAGPVLGNGLSQVITPTATGWQIFTPSAAGPVPGPTIAARPEGQLTIIPGPVPLVLGYGSDADGNEIFQIHRGSDGALLGSVNGGVRIQPLAEATLVNIDPDPALELIITSKTDVLAFPTQPLQQNQSVTVPIRFILDIDANGVPTMIRRDYFSQAANFNGLIVAGPVEDTPASLVIDPDGDGYGTVFAPRDNGAFEAYTWDGSTWTLNYNTNSGVESGAKLPAGVADPRGARIAQGGAGDVRALPVLDDGLFRWMNPSDGTNVSSYDMTGTLSELTTGTADFDGDGLDEAFAQRNGPSGRDILFFDADGQIAVEPVAGDTLLETVASDLDNDGRTEIRLITTDLSGRTETFRSYDGTTTLRTVFSPAVNETVGPLAMASSQPERIQTGTFGVSGAFLRAGRSALAIGQGATELQLVRTAGSISSPIGFPSGIDRMQQMGAVEGNSEAILVLGYENSDTDSEGRPTAYTWGVLVPGASTPAPTRTVSLSGGNVEWRHLMNEGSGSVSNGTTTTSGLSPENDHSFSPSVPAPANDG